jgi:hypothetical protein
VKRELIDYDAMMQGGVSGPPIVPRGAAGSLLFQRITGQKPPRMPLDNPLLKPKKINLIKKWIDAGAKND